MIKSVTGLLVTLAVGMLLAVASPTCDAQAGVLATIDSGTAGTATLAAAGKKAKRAERRAKRQAKKAERRKARQENRGGQG